MIFVTADFETYSEIDIKLSGVWPYAEHESTEILCLGYKIDRNPTRIWTPPDPFPEDLLFALLDGDVCVDAHNAAFERAIWKNLLAGQTVAKFYGEEYSLGTTPIPMPTRWRDTMATCAQRSLPLKLDDVGDVLKLNLRKDKAGKEILRKLSRPRKPTKKDPSTRLSYEAAEAEGLWDGLYTYCIRDVDSEDELGRTIGWLPPDEVAVWALDQKINQRGIYVDMPAVHAARSIAAEHNESLSKELCDLVGDPEMTAKKVAKFREWLADSGVVMPDMRKETVEYWLQKIDPEEFPEVARALEIRQQLSISSTAKLDTILNVVCADSRMRGLTQYHGSGTGRWAGRFFQPQNLPRPTATNYLDRGKPALDMDLLIEHLRLEYADLDLIDMIYGDVASALTSSLRGMITAAPGKRLFVSDFSAIEARVTAWVAGQQSKLDAFLRYDRGEGPDIYCVNAEVLFGEPVNKHDNPERRQLGKVQELGCGYQMSGPKLQVTASNAGIKIDEETAVWIVKTFRENNPDIVRLWYGLQNAAMDAVSQGMVADYNGITYRTVKDRAGPWLTCTLPSGRRLWYFNPRLEKKETSWGEERWSICYEGRDNKRNGAWGQVYTYGGMLTENVVQAISRCLLVAAMFRVEAANYPIVLTVHDEIISEVDDGFGTQKEYDALMAGPSPDWAAGCPVASAGWNGYRYKKD